MNLRPGRSKFKRTEDTEYEYQWQQNIITYDMELQVSHSLRPKVPKENILWVPQERNNGSFNYDGYNKLIGQIIEAINKEKNLNIDRLTFDRMLWYYYKGDEKLRQEALNEIPL